MRPPHRPDIQLDDIREEDAVLRIISEKAKTKTERELAYQGRWSDGLCEVWNDCGWFIATLFLGCWLRQGVTLQRSNIMGLAEACPLFGFLFLVSVGLLFVSWYGYTNLVFLACFFILIYLLLTWKYHLRFRHRFSLPATDSTEDCCLVFLCLPFVLAHQGRHADRFAGVLAPARSGAYYDEEIAIGDATKQPLAPTYDTYPQPNAGDKPTQKMGTKLTMESLETREPLTVHGTKDTSFVPVMMGGGSGESLTDRERPDSNTSRETSSVVRQGPLMSQLTRHLSDEAVVHRHTHTGPSATASQQLATPPTHLQHFSSSHSDVIHYANTQRGGPDIQGQGKRGPLKEEDIERELMRMRSMQQQQQEQGAYLPWRPSWRRAATLDPTVYGKPLFDPADFYRRARSEIAVPVTQQQHMGDDDAASGTTEGGSGRKKTGEPFRKKMRVEK
ncbi:unnamed protein product [Vitrella brassicaformis CCMP3155]|uniref:Uncharacterized protein n=1 Tax=Vitrella brassicaformis (strain CCMP3155) TaxID=1169540 RepID=A0A0G4EGM0_VITBC|nr:unnamed protein product [Vitrella brassicaformis CCMP3155]|eukprot:CEL95588.1 unnamed protein product [Vitrella brassicaformis CCMP3155]